MSTIDISRLIKAKTTFERFRIDILDDRDKAGAVQAFAFSYELTWKMMRRILIARGSEVGSPRDVFRKAALEQIIDDPELWFLFQQMRNLTTHTYEETIVNTIMSIFDQFSAELEKLIQRIQALI